MKNMLLAFYAVLIAFLILLIGFTLYGRSIRQVELNNAMKSSMEDAMVLLLYEESRPQNEDEWKAYFLQSVEMQIRSASDLSVTFLEADMEKGILSVEAELTWKHPIGTVGKVWNVLTVILEEYEE